jgi:hypothetical protein
MLDCLVTVQLQVVAERTLKTLREHGPMTIASIAQHHPFNAGLEELVACIRIAKAVGAASLVEKETVIIRDKRGVLLLASIPTFLLTADLFPDDLAALAI